MLSPQPYPRPHRRVEDDLERLRREGKAAGTDQKLGDRKRLLTRAFCRESEAIPIRRITTGNVQRELHQVRRKKIERPLRADCGGLQKALRTSGF